MNLVRLLGFAFATLACGATYKAHMHRVGDAEKAKDEKSLYAEAMAAAKIPGNFNRLDAYYRLAEYEFAKGRAAFEKAVALGATAKSGYSHWSYNGVKGRIADLERRFKHLRRLPGEPASDGAVAPCASGRRSKA